MEKANKPGQKPTPPKEESKGKKKKKGNAKEMQGNEETVYARPADVFRDTILKE